jgi:hypothetical protein
MTRFAFLILLCGRTRIPLLTFAVILCSSVAVSQTRTDWALTGADVGVRSLDVYSTHLVLTQGGREAVLPRAIADHTSTMALFSGGVIGLELGLQYELRKHKHTTLARWVPVVDIGIDAPGAVHNFWVRRKR